MLSCRATVEAITDYLEGRLGFFRDIAFRIHIRTCWQCRQYLDQIRSVVDALARLPIEGPPPAVMDGLRARLASLEPGVVFEGDSPPAT